jgi:hypothetical protein
MNVSVKIKHIQYIITKCLSKKFNKQLQLNKSLSFPPKRKLESKKLHFNVMLLLQQKPSPNETKWCEMLHGHK